jgi:hypothetical protein
MRASKGGLTNHDDLTIEVGKRANREQSGFTNGVGRGFTDEGVGFTNGFGGGFVNGAGRGFINGNGQKCGVGCASRATAKSSISDIRSRLKREDKAQRARAVVALAIAIILTATVPQIAMEISNTASQIAIDGLFNDWEGLPMYQDIATDVKNPHIDIVEYGRYDANGILYIYIAGADTLLHGNGTRHDTVVLMIENDGIRTTGYQSKGLGYDMMIKVSGYGGRIISMSENDFYGDNSDWGGWHNRGQPKVSVKDNQMEFKVICGKKDVVVVDAYFISADGEVEQIDCLLSANYVGYRVYQYGIADYCVGIGTNAITYLSMTCDASIVNITSIRFTMLGTADDSSFGRFTLKDDADVEVGHGFVNQGILEIDANITLLQNNTRNYTLSANLLENESGNTFLLYVESGYDFGGSRIIPKLYEMYRNYTYIGYAPSEIRIDGGFAEWDLARPPREDDGAINWERLSVCASDSYYENDEYSMAIRYYGSVLAGDIIPIAIESGNGSSGGAVENNTDVWIIPEDPITGEDILRVSIGGDRRVEICGKEGRITKSVFSILNGQNWMEVGAVDSYCNENNIEFTTTNITVNDYDVIRVESSNWYDNTTYYNHTHTNTALEFGELESLSPVNPMGDINELHGYGMNTSSPITIDGQIVEAGWADASTCQYIVDNTQDWKIFSQRDSTYQYIGIFAIETTINADDSANVYFDTWNAENTSPNNSSYKRIEITGTNGAGTITYYVGSGSGWSSSSLPSGWDAEISQTNYGGTNYRTYEFKMPLSDLNASNRFDALHETIGIGILVRDYKSSNPGAHNYWNWYPDAYYSGSTPTTQYMDKPDTWADLVYELDFAVRDYVIETPETNATITIDGDVIETEWMTEATHQIIYDPEGVEIARICVLKDDTYLYVAVGVCGRVPKDTANDFTEIIFDCDYDQTSLPDANDKRYQITASNGTAYFEGNGAGWVSATTPTGWIAKSGYFDNNSTYEFRMTLSELNETGNFWQQGDVIGMAGYTYVYETDLNQRKAIYFPDGTQYYVSFISTRTMPYEWGELMIEIPEYNVAIVEMGVFCLIVLAIARRKLRKGADCIWDGNREGEQRG